MLDSKQDNIQVNKIIIGYDKESNILGKGKQVYYYQEILQF